MAVRFQGNYQHSPYEFTGGTLKLVSVNVSGEPYIDVERHAEMLLKSQ